MPNSLAAVSKSGLFSKVALLLTGSLVISSAGTYLGQSLTSTFEIVSLTILFFIGAIAVPRAARSSTTAGVIALTIWTFISGLFLGPAIHQYAHILGWQTVFLTYLGSAGVMAVCGAIGALSGINFSGIGRWLLFALFGLIIVGIAGIFFPLSAGINIAYCLVGIVIFSLFFMYDFFRLAHSADTWEDAVSLAMSIYLDYINVLLFFLQLEGGSSSKSRS